MSLAIEVPRVTEVLLADGWHSVFDQSLTFDAYEWMEGPREDGGDAFVLWSGPPAVGFSFIEEINFGGVLSTTRQMYGPATAILAVRTDEKV